MPEAGWDHLMVKESVKRKVTGSGEHNGVSGPTENDKVKNMLKEYGLLDGIKQLHKEIVTKIDTYYDEDDTVGTPQALTELRHTRDSLEAIMDNANLEHPHQLVENLD